jgi:hypothetical protein
MTATVRFVLLLAMFQAMAGGTGVLAVDATFAGCCPYSLNFS